MSESKFEWKGKTYALIPAGPVDCHGCAFMDDHEACGAAGDRCIEPDGVWVEAWTGTAVQMTGQSVTEGKETNPKTAIGDKKVPLALCSPIASAHWSLAQFSGMCKYQAWNWRIAGVRSSTYISAMKRHLDAYVSGEEFDPVDGTHHLGNIMACAAILLDAQAAGKLNDDRPPSVDCRPTFKFVEDQMAVLREKYKHIEQKPFTIKDTVK